ncbi:DUF4968 domain-containing protein [Aliifodinibius sp. S!AR15-10]|uniref:hypothetical protein n=1 Tax=Aliifodinibius sp. S!AR15-10 TaxID=2950437 RepID=UPI00285A36DD|nr:hypothetical protein [Aliifodinibius sp. S!AR15-10]MDR8390628.1 DUF4968 domain-containing protein [Aliifodinibius sp. S!AR15-10]
MKSYISNTTNLYAFFLLSLFLLFDGSALNAQQITSHNLPAQLDIRPVSENSIRVTLKPLFFEREFPETPVLADHDYPDPVLSITKLSETVSDQVGSLRVEVSPDPLTVSVTNAEGEKIQDLVFHENGVVRFDLDDSPVLGMGEGGPRPPEDVNWRLLPIEFDRRGRLHEMHPRWQSNA